MRKQCCPDGQTCDTTKGCVEESQADCTADLDNNGSADGQWVGSFCVSTAGNTKDSLEKAKQFCSDRSMTLVRVKDICPSWNGSSDYKCSSWTISLDGLLADWGQIWFWTSETGCADYATIMATSQDYGADGVPSVYCATANEMSGMALMAVCK